MSLHTEDENKKIIIVNGAPEFLLQWYKIAQKKKKRNF